MPEKFFFVVSRRFQVERYLEYINILGLTKNRYEFICVSDWTNGDAQMALSHQPHVSILKPKYLGKKYFGNIFNYIFCVLLAWLNFFKLQFRNTQNWVGIVFIDQYYSPLEFLALSHCQNISFIILHQHSLNHINQLSKNRMQKIFEILSHKPLKNFSKKFFETEINYYGAFYSKAASRDANSIDLINKVFPIRLASKINLLNKFSKNKLIKKSGMSNKVVIISPGMFRYRNPNLINAQRDFFKQAINSINRIDSSEALAIRRKPGETLKSYMKLLDMDTEYLKDEISFHNVLKNNKTFVCSSTSTTWCEVLSQGKRCLVIRQKALEKEYPFFAELFSKMVADHAKVEKMSETNAYLITKEVAKSIFQDVQYGIKGMIVDNPISIKEMIACIRL